MAGARTTEIIFNIFRLFSFLCVCFCQLSRCSLVNKTFVTVWNVPTKICDKSGVVLNLSKFDIVANTGDTFLGNDIVIFYRNRLGLYPWIDENGNFINNGLPQLAELDKHLERVKEDVNRFIPNKTFSGLAVIDWEEWRPIFERNKYNDKQKIYVHQSMDIVRNKHPDWSDQRIESEARFEFENAAKEFMKSTLEMCKSLRPGGLWGFYGFPNCYNDKPGEEYCTENTKYLNDRLGWLFASSSALYPSVYLREDFGSHTDRYKKVYGTLNETSRLKDKYGSEYMPIYPYTKFRYGDTKEFYDMVDLNSTIRLIAEAGLNGMALWDSSAMYRIASDCKILEVYLTALLGPFVENVTTEVDKCSSSRCNSHGRCFKEYELNTNLHPMLKLTRFILDFCISIVMDFLKSYLFVDGNVRMYSSAPSLKSEFYQCKCFVGWAGEFCEHHING
ncbi:Hyaluronidase [Mactra antiquata]